MASPALALKIRLRQSVGHVVHAVRGPARAAQALRVLSYHHITETWQDGDDAQMTTPQALFAEHMAWLQEHGYRVLDAGTVVDMLTGRAPWPATPIAMLTFDDAYDNFLTQAWPVLERHRFPSTLFVPTAQMETAGHLTWDALRHVTATGLVTCGAHGVTHRKLRDLPDAELATELQDGKQELEQRLAQTVDLLAYPYGSFDAFDERVITATQRAGFAAAFTTVAGVNSAQTDRWRLHRTRISWVDGVKEFGMTMGGAFDWYAGYQRVTSR